MKMCCCAVVSWWIGFKERDKKEREEMRKMARSRGHVVGFPGGFSGY